MARRKLLILLLILGLLGGLLGSAGVVRAGSVGGAITVSDPTQTGGLLANGQKSACGSQKMNPGLVQATGPRGYDSYSYRNNTAGPICVTVTLTNTGPSNSYLAFPAYLGSFNPSSPNANYLADSGFSLGGGSSDSYGFTLPSGATALIVVVAATIGGTDTYTLAVTPNSGQSMAFPQPPDKTYGDAPFTVSATGGTSGNPVTFAASTADVCTVGAPTTATTATVTLVGVGICTVAASQAGGGIYDPAPTVSRSFVVKATVPTIASLNPATLVAGSGDTLLTITGSGFYPGVGRQVFLSGFRIAPTRLDDTHLRVTIPAARLTSAGQYSVTVVTYASGGGTSNVATLTVTPAPAPPSPPSPVPAPSFVDVPTDYWAYPQITTFAQREITTGCDIDAQGNRYYCPERTVSRAEMAVFLARTLGRDKLVPPSTPTFADVPTGYWAYAQIEAFAKLGITTGCGTDEQGRMVFCPEREVTRAEMAAFLVRARGQAELQPANPTFADVPNGYWAYGWVERFFTLQITKGCGTDGAGNTYYCPERGVTRAEMAVFIIRAYP